MKKIFIVGAGGFGREMLAWLLDMPQQDWGLAGFLDDNPAALDGFHTPVGVVGTVSAYKPSPEDRLLCAIGDPQTKMRLYGELKARNAQFFTFIHHMAVVGTRCKLGEGCVLCPGAVVTTDAVLGDLVALNVHAVVGHDATLGYGCTLSPYSTVSGGAKVGEGVFLGSHAVVLPQAAVGDHVRVGAGSVVLRKAAAGTSVFGVPAKILKSRS